MNEPSPILGLDGKPLPSIHRTIDGKHFAIVGTINVHATVFELAEGEDMQTAIRKQQIMVKNRDPKLEKQTSSMVFFWAEDDETRRHNRIALMQQVAIHMELLREDGTSPMPRNAFELTHEMLGRSEKGSGDVAPPPTAA